MLTKNTDTMRQEIAAHIAADAVVAGQYWRPADNELGGAGCFIACLTHSDSAAAVTERFGMPEPLVLIAEHIFEDLPDQSERVAFFRAIGEAIGDDGRDLTPVTWLFLADALQHLPTQDDMVQSAIDGVIDGMMLLAAGREWPDAARCASDAARYPADPAASAAYAAARYPADPAASAAEAAYAAASAARCAAEAARVAARVAASYTAEIRRRRDALLRMIRDAK